jgi:hypothetical protein
MVKPSDELEPSTPPYHRGAHAADEAVRLFEEFEDERGIARAWRLLHEVGWGRCRFGDSATALERALAATPFRDFDERLVVLCVSGDSRRR